MLMRSISYDVGSAAPPRRPRVHGFVRRAGHAAPAQELAVAETTNGLVRGKNNGSSEDGTEERASTGLVNTCNTGIASEAGRTLVLPAAGKLRDLLHASQVLPGRDVMFTSRSFRRAALPRRPRR